MRREEDEYENGENTMKITLLILKASARCFAPSFPILFSKRFSEVSVYV